MMAQAHEVHYLCGEWRQTSGAQSLGIYLHVSQHRVYVKPLFNKLASYTSSEDCTNVQASETTTSRAEMVMDTGMASEPC